CTGRLPFHGKDTVSTLMAVATEKPDSPARIDAEVPAALSALVMKLLEKDPARRIASADKVVQALRELEQRLDATQIVAPTPPKRAVNVSDRKDQRATRDSTPPKKSRVPLVLAMAGILAGGVVATIVLWPRTVPDEPKGPPVVVKPSG